MRTWLLLAYWSLAVPCQASSHCKGLAETFATSSSMMDATSLAKVRGCIDGSKWEEDKAQKALPPGPADKLLVLDLGDSCKKLSGRFATHGPGSLAEAERIVLRGCVDKAITIISAQPRPGHKASKETPKRLYPA